MLLRTALAVGNSTGDTGLLGNQPPNPLPPTWALVNDAAPLAGSNQPVPLRIAPDFIKMDEGLRRCL